VAKPVIEQIRDKLNRRPYAGHWRKAAREITVRENVEVSYNYLYRVATGRVADPPFERTRAIARYLGIRI